jgi:hypothetical protein
VEEKNYGQTLVHFAFATSSPRLIEDFYVLYEVFGQLGAQHRVVANIEQEEKHLEVIFTQFEPDYLYDTFWREESAPALTFRSGVQDAWSQWWLPCVVAVIAILTARWRAIWCAASLSFAGALLWEFLVLDSEPVPGRYPWAAGLVTGLLVVALITLPVRFLLIARRRNSG